MDLWTKAYFAGGVACGFATAYGTSDLGGYAIDTNIEIFEYSAAFPLVLWFQVFLINKFVPRKFLGQIVSRKELIERMAATYTGSVLGMSICDTACNTMSLCNLL